jgi:hypothetical protein
MKYKATCLSGAVLLLASCTVYKSHFPGQETGTNAMVLPEDTGKKQGLHYFLPRAELVIIGSYQETKDAVGDVVEKQYVTSVTKTNKPDAAMPLFVEITENVMYDEATTLKAPNGLLNSSVTKPEDKTGEILETLAATIVEVARINAYRTSALADERVAAPPTNLVRPFRIKIDPLDPKSREAGIKKAKDCGIDISIDNVFDAPPGTTPRESIAAKNGMLQRRQSATKKDVTNANGLAYRRPQMLRLSFATAANFVFDKSVSKGQPVGSVSDNMAVQDTTVPDPRTLAVIPIKRGFMSRRETNVTFVQGEITEFDLKQPSPVLGAVKVPFNIVKMVGQAIPAILQVKQDAPVKEMKSQNDLLQMQINQMKLENELRQLQQTRGVSQ